MGGGCHDRGLWLDHVVHRGLCCTKASEFKLHSTRPGVYQPKEVDV